MQQSSEYFRLESELLYNLVKPLDDAAFTRETLFKSWTIDDVIGHLHLWNIAADLTLNDPDGFQAFLGTAFEVLLAGGSHQDLTRQYVSEALDGISGHALLAAYKDLYEKVADMYSKADENLRVKWGGPDMTTKSCIIARQMETWAHAQAVFDLLGETREATDRLKNVAHIGVTTYRWTFVNRQQEAPQPKPYVCLTAPSGGLWEWNEPQADNYVKGDAEQFCQVVTQTRSIEDTQLNVVGDSATQWMAIAQCFAGGAENPPAKGQRTA